MKVPRNLQYTLTKNCNRFLVRNLNGEIFTNDPFRVFNRNTAKDQGFLGNTGKYLEVGKENKSLVLVTKKQTKRITKRKGKRSSRKSTVTTVTKTDTQVPNSLGSTKCCGQVFREKRVEKARKRALVLAEDN